MSRAPFQVLVLPFRRPKSRQLEFAALRRNDDGNWQGIAGGGHLGESPEKAALREANEEAGLSGTLPIIRLHSMCSIPTCHFAARRQWPSRIHVIPEYSFAIDCTGLDIHISKEHSGHAWGTYTFIRDLLRWESNRTALWELNERLRNRPPSRSATKKKQNE